MPILEWLPGYQWQRHLAHDVVAAIVVVAVMLPQELAFGASMHVPVSTTLRTAIVAPLIYCVCGTSSMVSFANAAELTWAVGGALQTIPDDQEFERLAKGTLITCTSGVVLLLLGWFRVGTHLPLSRPAMGGFLWGASLLVLAEHIPHLVGVVDVLTAPSVHIEACALGAFSLVLLVAVEGIRQRKSVLVRPSLSKLNDPAVLLHAYPTGSLNVSSSSNALSAVDLAPLGVCGLGLALRLWVSFPDDASSTTHPHHHGNQSLYESFTLSHAFHHVVSQEVEEVMTLLWNALIIALELIAYGLACVVGGSFRALPPAGGLARTAINAKYSRTAVTTLCTTFVLVVVMVSKVYVLVPLPCLAAIIVVSTVSFMDRHELQTMLRCRLYSCLGLWAAACISTFLGGILIGALVALCLSVGATRPVHDRNDQVIFVRVDAAVLCFVNWDVIEKQVELFVNVGEMDVAGSTKDGVVMDLSNIHDGAHDLETVGRINVFSRRLKHHGVDLAITHAPPSNQDVFHVPSGPTVPKWEKEFSVVFDGHKPTGLGFKPVKEEYACSVDSVVSGTLRDNLAADHNEHCYLSCDLSR
ncbi:hypothetical protein DYB28_005890 [Aphanomyces astaci]|uniref:SLC26A/SulP transporter domain-containing protein n=1 Tax=Aphanomyces astaci TaxID=112090 RepID=A0A397F063_APHAT|nr:hypothetical protein DYB36_005008 [Aphanomyces astaci]RHX97857.1 hypothetical protein DYB25_004622 [Aphanomyces astaci]RHY40794.1 hypothetical protein DYB30_004011 [Aphanomyces astaci]RHY47670.1 hypothetical protein DYB38_001864 [Aphanomyces astaci]RHY50694.1 hypothetical protein DYB34_005578 [Aphanomyces astaci]